MLGKLREKYEATVHPLGVQLGKLGLRPNAITTMSFLVSCSAGYAYAVGAPLLGAGGLLVSGFVDMLDGAVARATKQITRFGGVYDHVLDRYAEFIVLLGIGLSGLVFWGWVLFALFGMVMASYVRAKAESVGGLRSCTVGLAERQEKIILLVAGSFLQPYVSFGLTAALIIIGIISHVTVIQRLHYTFEQARGLHVEV